MQQVVLVDELDQEIGVMEKMEAHQKALLHRAFSVFIFNRKGEWLLQRRAWKKYHSGGLWTNACCSHPRPGETVIQAAERRLDEELGFTTRLEKAFDFIYQASFENGLTEYEYDHVLLGEFDGEILPNPDEVEEYCFVSSDLIRQNLARMPEIYTAWFAIAFSKVTGYQAGKR